MLSLYVRSARRKYVVAWKAIRLTFNRHECPGHGEYEDSDDEKNLRLRVNLKPALPTPKNRKSASPKENKASFGKEVTIHHLIGLEEDRKTVSGPFWARWRDSADHGFGDQEVCSPDCFWPKKTRTDHSSSWSEEDERTLKMLRPAFENDKRGACIIAQTRLISKSCKEVCYSYITLGEWNLQKYRSFSNSSKQPQSAPAIRCG